jgi:hypothetical protein
MSLAFDEFGRPFIIIKVRVATGFERRSGVEDFLDDFLDARVD